MIDFLTFMSEHFWCSAATVASIAVVITGFINGLFAIKGFWQQIVSWFVAGGLAVGAHFLGLMVVQEPLWLNLTCSGLIVGLVSNGIYDIPTIQKYIDKLYNLFHKPCV